jgi:hypothetical protein
MAGKIFECARSSVISEVWSVDSGRGSLIRCPSSRSLGFGTHGHNLEVSRDRPMRGHLGWKYASATAGVRHPPSQVVRDSECVVSLSGHSGRGRGGGRWVGR